MFTRYNLQIINDPIIFLGNSIKFNNETNVSSAENFANYKSFKS